MKMLFVFIMIVGFAACNNGGTKTPGDSTSVKFDTATGSSNPATMTTDTTNVKSMNADTSGMSQAR